MPDQRQPAADEVGLISDLRRTDDFDPAVLLPSHGLGVPALTQGVDDGHHLGRAVACALEVVGGQDLERRCGARSDAGCLVKSQRRRQSNPQAGEAAWSASGPDAREVLQCHAAADQQLVDHRDQLARRTPLGRGQDFEVARFADRHADDRGAGVECEQRRHAGQYTGGRPWLDRAPPKTRRIRGRRPPDRGRRRGSSRR